MFVNATPEGPLQIVAAAVTPVVMVSSTAILISGVNARYIAVSDRIRTLAREARDGGTSAGRIQVIKSQMVVFQRRVYLVSWAIRILYVATALFMTIALLITATPWRTNLETATVPLFLLGIALIMVAITCQILELQASNHTIFLEMQDVVPQSVSKH